MNAEFLEKDIEIYMNPSSKKAYVTSFSRKNLSAENFMGARIHIAYPEAVAVKDEYATVISVTEADNNTPAILYSIMTSGVKLMLGYKGDKIAYCTWGPDQFTIVDTKEEVDQPVS